MKCVDEAEMESRRKHNGQRGQRPAKALHMETRHVRRWNKMASNRTLVAAALMVLALGVGGATAQARSGPGPAAIDRYIEERMAANRIPGLALAITRGDRVLYL